MHILERNKKDLWFSNPVGWTYATDSNGFKTGEKTIVYAKPTKVRMSMAISSGANNLGSQGMADIEPFGLKTGYTHRAVTEDMSCAMGEESHVWYGIAPTQTVTQNGKDVEVPVPHNFVVVRRADSINHIIYYLKEVDVQYPAVSPTPVPTPSTNDDQSDDDNGDNNQSPVEDNEVEQEPENP